MGITVEWFDLGLEVAWKGTQIPDDGEFQVDEEVAIVMSGDAISVAEGSRETALRVLRELITEIEAGPPLSCPACGDTDGPCDIGCTDPGCDQRDCESHDGCEPYKPDPDWLAVVEVGLAAAAETPKVECTCPPFDAEPWCPVCDCTCARDESNPCKVHDPAEPYDHSRAKEDARNAAPAEPCDGTSSG